MLNSFAKNDIQKKTNNLCDDVYHDYKAASHQGLLSSPPHIFSLI